jgi:hypothetical protein
MTKAEIATYLAGNVAGTGSASYEFKRYMKMSKAMLVALLDDATAPNPEARQAARQAFVSAVRAR